MGRMVALLDIFKDGQRIDCVSLSGRNSFVMGRHVDCDIMVTHLSVSRHHVEIQLLRETREIVVIDLESVHGTWINGDRISSLVPVAVKENDIIKFGGSSRTYRVWWDSDSASDEEQLEKDFPGESVDSVHSNEGNVTETGSTRTGISYSESRQKEELHSEELGKETRSAESCGGEEKAINTRSQRISQKDRSESLPPKVPIRIPFEQLELTGMEEIVPRSLNLRKKLPAGKRDHKEIQVQQVPREGNKKLAMGQNAQAELEDIKQVSSSNLWLRRCNSAPLPILLTAVPSAPPLPEQKIKLTGEADENNSLTKLSGGYAKSESATDNYSTQSCSQSIFLDEQKHEHGISVSCGPLDSEIADEEFPPDKENMPPPLSCPVKIQSGIANLEKIHASESHWGSSRGLEQPLQNLQTMDGKKAPRYQWHILVDTVCLMDDESFRSLKQLEGIKETRLIIPNIVIRELDYIKRRDGSKGVQNVILKWIESCMVRVPSWIHVQNSSECFPVRVTPPSSPHHSCPGFSPFGSIGDLMSPTNDDHVLECALLFSKTVLDGKIALLTNHTALKIKAMAEGIICESAAAFCESLLSPYSERFLWAGSIAHGPNWIEKPSFYTSTPISTNELNKKTVMSAASEKHHVVEGLKNHCNQARGLKVILTRET
eukprot:c21006_g1_i2 orf=58-2034(+)